jgi:hypothetical protein
MRGDAQVRIKPWLFQRDSIKATLQLRLWQRQPAWNRPADKVGRDSPDAWVSL